MTENEDGASGAVSEFYEEMRKHYPHTGRLIDSFIAHTGPTSTSITLTLSS
jgi:hypothetical protein